MQKSPINILSLKNKFKSINELSKSLWDLLPEDIKKDISQRSLATKIGLIYKGEITWWVKRPEISKPLAELLEVPIEDLGIHESLSNNVLNFEEFSALPPLDLDKEKLFPLGEAFGTYVEFNLKYKFHELKEKAFEMGLWLKSNNIFHTPNTKSWIQVTDKSLLKYLKIYFSTYAKFPVIQINKLEDIKQYVKRFTPLIFFVDEIRDLSEFSLIQKKYTEDGYFEHGILVISFSDKNLHAQVKRHHKNEFDKMKTHPYSSESYDVEIYEWEKPNDWKYKLTEWVVKRVDNNNIDSYLNVDAINVWLKKFDEDSNWFKNIDEVLTLCHIAHKRGETKLPSKDSKTAGEELCSIAFAMPNDDFDTINQFVKNLWRNDKYDWEDSFNKEHANIQTNKILSEICNRNPIQDDDREKLEKLITPKELDVQLLIKNKLVKTITAGHYAVSQQTIFNLLARDCFIYDLTNNLEETLWIFFDVSRLNLAKACLNTLPIDELIELTKNAIATNKTNRMAMGLIECLFIELSNKVSRCDQKINQKIQQNQQIIKALFDCFEWFENDDENYFILLDHKVDEWELACFYWSSIENLNYLDKDHSAFPGWINDFEVDHCNSLYPTEQRKNKLIDLDQRWTVALDVAQKIAKSHSKPLKQSSKLFDFTYIINAANGQYEIDPEWWKTIDKYPSDWETAYFDKLLADQLSNQAIIKMLSSYYVYLDNSDKSMKYLDYMKSQIIRILLDRIEIYQKFLEIPTKLLDKIELFYKYNDMPKRLFEFVVSRHFESGTLTNMKAIKVIERIGIKIADYLPDLLKYEVALESYEDKFESQVARYYWRWRHDKASEIFEKRYKEIEKISLQRLIWECPQEHTQIAYTTINELDLFDQDEATKWLNKRLKNAKRLAQTLLNGNELNAG